MRDIRELGEVIHLATLVDPKGIPLPHTNEAIDDFLPTEFTSLVLTW